MDNGFINMPQQIDRLKIASELQLRWQSLAGMPTDRVICPLCWNTDSGVETSDEHVFPDCIDGRIRMITCKSCNNNRGSKQDSQLGLELAQHRAMIGNEKHGSVSVNLEMGGSRLTANMHSRSAGNVDLVIVDNKRATNPADIEASKEYMKDGTAAKIKIRHRVPHPVILNQAVMKSCYLAASMFFGYVWSRSSAPDFVRRIGIGENAPDELNSLAYRFPRLGMTLEDEFMIGGVSDLDVILLTFPVGRESAYFRGAILPYADQSLDQYLCNSTHFFQKLKLGNNPISYDWCFTFNSRYEISQLLGEHATSTTSVSEHGS